MILPIIIHVQFHEIMDKPPFVKTICFIRNRIPLPQTIFVQDMIEFLYLI